jgi:hypothetical protein
LIHFFKKPHPFVMFVPTKYNDHKGTSYEYLHIVRSYREGARSANRCLPAWDVGTACPRRRWRKRLRVCRVGGRLCGKKIPPGKCGPSIISGMTPPGDVWSPRSWPCAGKVDLQQRLAARDHKVSWPDLMRHLAQVQSDVVGLDGRRQQLRTDMMGATHHALAAADGHPLGPMPEPESDPYGSGASW